MIGVNISPKCILKKQDVFSRGGRRLEAKEQKRWIDMSFPFLFFAAATCKHLLGVRTVASISVTFGIV